MNIVPTLPGVFRVERTGEFEAQPYGGEHCGFGELMFKYRVAIETSTLDGQGFAIAVEDLQGVIKRMAGGAGFSCERLAERMAGEIMRTFVENRRMWSLLRVEAAVAPVARPMWATFTWAGERLSDWFEEARANKPCVSETGGVDGEHR